MKKNYSKNFETTVKAIDGFYYVVYYIGGYAFVKKNGEDWTEMTKDEVISAGITAKTVIKLQKKLGYFNPETICRNYNYLSK